jgi:hypothetical protein
MHSKHASHKAFRRDRVSVTPFKEDLSLDLPALHENLTKLLQIRLRCVRRAVLASCTR